MIIGNRRIGRTIIPEEEDMIKSGGDRQEFQQLIHSDKLRNLYLTAF